MNRKQGRTARARKRSFQLRLHEADSRFDIQVEGKVEQVVMICANPKGRTVVEHLWPDVEWSSDEFFSRVHSAEWLFTHLRVMSLPPH
jgi:hypothetical protein